MSKKDVLNIGIVCGEHSGDRLGAGLIEELNKHYDVNLFGVGGPKLEKLGLKSYFHYSEINIMGLLDPLLNIFKLTRLIKNLIRFQIPSIFSRQKLIQQLYSSFLQEIVKNLLHDQKLE